MIVDLTVMSRAEYVIDLLFFVPRPGVEPGQATAAGK